jgi:hypothetical protein
MSAKGMEVSRMESGIPKVRTAASPMSCLRWSQRKKLMRLGRRNPRKASSSVMGRDGDAEGQEDPCAGGGLGEVLENGRRFGHGEEVASERDAEAGDHAESGERKGPAKSRGEVPVDALEEGAIPPEAEDERGEGPEDDVNGRLHGNGVDDIAADLLHEHGDADVRMRGVNGEERDKVSADESGENEQDENENVAEVRDQLWRRGFGDEFEEWRRRSGALDGMPEVARRIAGDGLGRGRDRWPGGS